MPTHYRIDSERKLISSTAIGVVVDDDLRGHQRTLLNDPAFDPSFDQLWDFREVADVEISTNAVREFARARSFAPGAKRALVATKDAAYGMARMFQALHEDAPEDLRVFRSLDEAKIWLGLD